jgi:cytochrome b
LLWGVFGSDTARFAHFVRMPGEIRAHVRTLFRRAPDPHAGHNALGGWSVLLMLAVLLLQACTGLFADDDVATAGPLADEVSRRVVRWCTRLHKYSENVLLGLIALHLAGVAWHAWFKRETLVRPMLTGRQVLPEDPGLRFGSVTRALMLAAISAAAVWALVSLP